MGRAAWTKVALKRRSFWKGARAPFPDGKVTSAHVLQTVWDVMAFHVVGGRSPVLPNQFLEIGWHNCV